MRRILLAAATAIAAIALIAGATPSAQSSGGGGHLHSKKHEATKAKPAREARPSRPLPSPDEIANISATSRRSPKPASSRSQGKNSPSLTGDASSTLLPVPTADVVVGMRALVISAGGTEPSLTGITGSLDQMGVPYDVMDAIQTPLTPGFLVNSQGEGNYYAVLLATANLVYENGGQWLSAFEPAEWDLLAQYQAVYGIREVDYYTFPTAEFGLGDPVAIDTLANPIIGRLTAAGRDTFPYLVDAVPVSKAWTYLAQPIDSNTVPLVTAPDGSALVSLRTEVDGREAMVLTMDGQAYLTHSILLGYGVIDWATRGVFIGERAVYSVPQVDDFFYPDALWDPETLTTIEEPGYRTSADDLKALIAWQDRLRTQPQFSGIMAQMVFNGEGASLRTDALTKTAVANAAKFRWVNHTWDHENMNLMTYTVAKAELSKNNSLASNLKLPGYTKSTLVTPEISGLSNAAAVKAMVDTGVKYAVGDTSRPELDNPGFNIGLRDPVDRRLYIIPRYPTNIFYNVSTPEELTSEYNHMHRAYWGRDLTYAEILDFESDVLVSYMLTHSNNPVMYHAGNLRAYDGARSLMADVLDATFAKYARYYNLPVRSPAQQEIGRRMEERAAWQAAGVAAKLVNGKTIVLRSRTAAKVPVTGAAYGLSQENYGTETISWVILAANTPLTIMIS